MKPGQNKSSSPLRLLLIEDSEDDALLIIRKLKQGGFEPDWQRVDDVPALREALQSSDFEIVISDYAMPTLNGLKALDIFKSYQLDIPFIIVSGTIGEDLAVEAMRAGASDYLLKDKLTRLVPAVQRELRESQDRQKRKSAEKELSIQRVLHEELFLNAPEAVILLDQEKKGVRVNPEFTRMFGYTQKEIEGKDTDDLIVPADLKEEGEVLTRTVSEGNNINVQTVRKRKDGKLIDVSILGTRIELKDKYIGYYWIYRDVSEQKKAEQNLIRSEERFRQLVNTIPAIVWRYDTEALRYTFVSQQAETILGYSIEDWKEDQDFRLNHLHPEDRELALRFYANAMNDKQVYRLEYRLFASDGKVLWFKDYVNIIVRNGKTVELIGVMVDITEAKKSAEALVKSEKRFRDMADLLPLVIFETDLKGNTTFVNQAICQVLNRKPQELIGSVNIYDCVAPEDRQRAIEDTMVILTGKQLGVRQYTGQNFEGKKFPVYVQAAPIYQDGQLVGVRGVLMDISEQKKVEASLRESEARFRTVVETLDEGIVITDMNDVIIYMNTRTLSMTGYSQEELLGKDAGRLLLTGEAFAEGRERLKLREKGTSSKYITRIQRKDGSEFWAEVNGAPFRNEAGKIIGTLGALTDITERFQAEEALRASETRHRELFESALTGISVTAPDGRIKACNPAFARIYGFESVEKALESNILKIYPNPEKREELIRLLKTRKKLEYYELEVKNLQGKQLFVVANMIGSFNEEGELEEVTAYVFDDTPRKEIEQQLNQAQKMESLGTLAGGIAHDFNNLLSVINGYSELLLNQVDTDSKTGKFLKQIHEAGERAVNLTSQILAFSRRQHIQPRIVNLNSVVENISKMIRRLIGDDIILKTFFNSDETRVKIDPVQIEQLVMNLAVNARDAMPGGGTLMIETGLVVLDENYTRHRVGVEPGRYVLLAISDNGIGMDPATREKIFEPFFTTKGKGKGTGLGLSTVYGIVKQNHGHIWVYSEPGRGTVFKIYLPHVLEKEDSSSVENISREVLTGTETILIVEDDDAVRSLCRENLEAAGYAVMEAENGKAALEVARKEGQNIDLVLTDIIMPGMNGRELAEKLDGIIPGIKVVYISGYTDNALLQLEENDRPFDFIPKPFPADVLLKKIRDVLDRDPGEKKPSPGN